MNKIRHLRVAVLKLNQHEFARLIGVSNVTVGNWETRGMKPSLQHAKIIIDLTKNTKTKITLEDIFN